LRLEFGPIEYCSVERANYIYPAGSRAAEGTR
jgi:hypothetical protein